MLTSELSELAGVVERIRATVHPELDKSFVDAVLQAEANAAGQDAAALQAIRAAVESALEAPAD
jgi:hypothetical protein